MPIIPTSNKYIGINCNVATTESFVRQEDYAQCIDSIKETNVTLRDKLLDIDKLIAFHIDNQSKMNELLWESTHSNTLSIINLSQYLSLYIENADGLIYELSKENNRIQHRIHSLKRALIGLAIALGISVSISAAIILWLINLLGVI